MKIASATVAWLAALSAAPVAAERTGRADRVFLDGRVWTGDAARPLAQALAVRGTTLLAVGGNGAVRRFAGKGTEVVNLGGAFVAPGFVDAQANLLAAGASLEQVNLHGARTEAEVRERIDGWLRTHPESQWVIGRGWSAAAFGGGLPTREPLDAVVGSRPAWLVSHDGRAGWAGSAALRMAGITRETPDPPGGLIRRGAGGEPTGVLQEAAMPLVERLLPKALAHEKRRALTRAIARAASWGLTSVHDAGIEEADLEHYAWALDQARQLRVYAALVLAPDAGPEVLARQRSLADRVSSRWLRVGAVKGRVDGTVADGTAALFEPYASGGTGLTAWTQKALDQAVGAYDAAGWQLMLDASGDRGIEMALKALERASRVNGTQGRRHRIERLELPRAADLVRLRAAGIVASTRPPHAASDPEALAACRATLGPERARGLLPFGAIDAAGVRQVFGSDWPSRPADVLRGIQGAVRFSAGGGHPAGGSDSTPRLGVEAALRHFTADAAFAELADGERGRLAPGLAADFVVLSRDPLAVSVESLLEVRVLRTVLGGQDTFRAGENEK